MLLDEAALVVFGKLFISDGETVSGVGRFFFRKDLCVGRVQAEDTTLSYLIALRSILSWCPTRRLSLQAFTWLDRN